MHRSLAIPEVVYAICEAVREDALNRFDSKKTLAALARTCRIFQEPALDNLWYELQDFRPLVQCLPPEAWMSIPDTSSRYHSMALIRSLTQSDFETIRRYSRRVRVICIGSDRAFRVDAESLRIFDLLPSPLFPRLRELTWHPRPGEVPSYLRLFFCKELISVNITTGTLEAPNITSINIMASLFSPSILRRLHIHVKQAIHGESIQFPPIGPDYEWSALRALTLPGPTPEDIVRIGNLPNLQEFTIVGHHLNHDQMKSSGAGWFPSLRLLRIEDFPEVSARWLPLFRNAKLVELSMFSSIDSICGDAQWRELFANLEKNVNHGSLRMLKIVYIKIPIPTLRASDIFPALLCFHELQSFTIKLRRSLPLSLRETLNLTKSWPNITTARFPPISDEPGFCSDLSSLALWAKHCPKLEHLQLSVDASNRDGRRDLVSRLMDGEFNAMHSPLTSLDVGLSPITHKEFVALFLSKLFPNLRVVVGHGRIQTYRRWGKVSLLISLMRASLDTSRKTIGEGPRNLRSWWEPRDNNNSDEESDG